MAEHGVKPRLTAMLAADMVGQVERANKMLVPLRLQSLPKRPSPSAGRAGWEEEDCIGWPIDVEADDIPQLVGEQGSLESLKALMRSGRSLYAPQFRWHRARRDAVPTMPRTVRRSRLAGRLLDRGRHHPSTTSAESAPALLIDQTVDIFPDETLDAIDAPSAWIRRPVA